MRNSLLFIFLILTSAAFSQYKAGLAYYNHYEYAKAIPLFKKASQKNNSAAAASLAKLADCFLYTKDYRSAESYYRQAIAKGDDTASIRYNYALSLKANNQYDEALKEFNLFLKAHPTDERAKNAVKAFKEIKAWQSLPKEYELVNVEAVNTPQSEFSPFIYENKLFFISWQEADLVNFEKYDFDGEPYLNVDYVELKDSLPSGERKAFTKKINSEFHDGPVSFSDKNELYLTRVSYKKGDKNFVNRPQLFVSEKKGMKWGSLKPFQYNDPNYTLAHAAVSNDGDYLFFSSDMPGGFGGTDIWFCKRNGTTWEKPVNLGPDVNTIGNEEFPYFRKDGILFFSSDGLPGYGGMDIFSARQIAGKWILNRNEGAGINSFADDFGIFFTNAKKGYISSNRDGGKGNDDIYSFTYSRKVITVDGSVAHNEDGTGLEKGLKIILEDSAGNRLADTRTNEQGYFRFDNLSPDNKYMAKIDEEDASFDHFKKYYYVDAKGQVMRVTLENSKGEKFVFQNLPSVLGSLPQLSDPEDATLAGNLLYGEEPSKPVANKEVLLLDADGNVVDKAYTNSFGAFVFNKIHSGDDYFIQLAEDDASLPNDAVIIMTNKSGKKIKVVKASGRNFKFGLLASDTSLLNQMTAEDNDLEMNIKGRVLNENKAPIKKLRVYLFSDKMIAIDTVVTTDDGGFNFSKLHPAFDYVINVDENDAQLNGLNKIYITDAQGKIIRELVRDKYRGFAFHVLKSDKGGLRDIFVEDPWLEVLELNMGDAKESKKEEITIIENVYYALNAYKFNDEGARVMDKVIQIMKLNPHLDIEIDSHTDAQGDDKLNLILSQKRAKYAIDYIVSKGISAKRLKAVGYGETKLLNKCGNGIQCTEAEHAQNRRTEFRIVDTSKK